MPITHDPCPCGSGKEAGDCCLAARPATDFRARKLERSSAELRARLIRYSQQEQFRRDAQQAFVAYFDARREDISDPDDEPSFARFLDWFVHDYRLPSRGSRIIELFMREARPFLGPVEKQLLRDWNRSCISLFQVVARVPGRGTVLEDLLRGGIYPVRDASLSRMAMKWSLMVGRLLKVGDSFEPSGAAVLLPPLFKQELTRRLKRRLQGFRRRYRGASWEDFLKEKGHTISSLVGELHRQWSRPRLVTSDGDDLVCCRAIYKVKDDASVRARLDRLPYLYRVGPEGKRGGHYAWIASGPAAPGPAATGLPGIIEGSRLLVGTISHTPGRLVLECYSRQRLEAGKEMLYRALGSLLQYQADVIEDIHQKVNESLPGVGGNLPPEMVARLAGRVLEQYYRTWADEPMPALKGRTPRQACRSRRGRAQVVELLNQMEYLEERKKEAGEPHFDVNKLRQELGLL